MFFFFYLFFFNDTATTEIYTLSLHDALPIYEFRGRIMAFYSMTVVGMLPLGHLAGGAVAEKIGPRWTVFIGGLLCLAAALWFRRALPMIRQSIGKREAA